MLREKETVDGALDDLRALVQALRAPACYSHPVGRISIIETHISFVILTGTFAYKIKKPVDLGFLDFTTLEKRWFFCQEELRLNLRLAPQLYLGVVPICGPREAPLVGEGAPVIEYAVKMAEFPQDALADRMLARGKLTSSDIDALAAHVADFHARSNRCGESDAYAAPEAVLAGVIQNFTQIRAVAAHAQDLPLVDHVEKWTLQEHARLRSVFAARKRDGMIRECHGDLHLGNIAFLDGKPCVFDCIEFNPDFRWIDVISEVAFLVMDLRAADRPDLARRFLNAYLEFTGDYAGLRTLRYFLVYRAMVRAKVGLMRARQLGLQDPAAAPAQKSFRHYLELARSCAMRGRGFIAITHGFSGSGKTTLSRSLVELTGAIRIRSDVERKRMHVSSNAGCSKPAAAEDLYSVDMTDSTYRRLLELSMTVLDSGHGVIVDATFLKQQHRDLFRAFAASVHVPFSIVDFAAPEKALRERIAARIREGQDASDADLGVLEHQLATQEPLRAEEAAFVFTYDASRPADEALQLQSWAALLQRLALVCD
jgi:aminoglycoside phosphotransferase family enzyme/predicted kinase